MKTLRMSLMLSFTFAAMMTLAAPSQKFELKYLSEVSHGEILATIPVVAADQNEALVKANKPCVSKLMDLHLSHEDIVDICNNPRL
jgi:hypothetical protein